MKLHTINHHEILIPKNRQRREFKHEEIVKLASSISQNGLIQPIVVRKDADGSTVLIAGERRLRALNYVWNFGEAIRCGEYTFPEGHVPCLFFGEMNSLDAFEMELEENIRRVDLTWQERAAATAALHELRTKQAVRDGRPTPTSVDIAEEIYGKDPSGAPEANTRKELIVARHLHDEDVLKAKSTDEAIKILKRKESLKKSEELAASVGATFTSSVHRLEQGDCFEIMADIPDGSFDVILTDPPYGIDADSFGDSGGGAHGAHFYDDSWTTWNKLAQRLSAESYRLAKPQAHAYIFCDIDNFIMFKSFMQEAGWKVFRTPLIWYNPPAFRAPWPDQGPQRKYQIILYTVKGNKPVTRLYSDVLTYQNDENLNHPAQKPVAVYTDLLRRSTVAGDSVLDPFMGSGTIVAAAHEMKCKATGIEIDDAAFGIAVKRLKDLI